MIDWFKKKSPAATPQQIVSKAVDLLDRFGALMEKYPGAFVDESELPANKAAMKAAMKVGLRISKSEEQREAIKVAWMTLYWFRPGLGKIAVDGNFGDAQTPESLEKLERFLRLGKESEAERDADWAELQTVLKTLS